MTKKENKKPKDGNRKLKKMYISKIKTSHKNDEHKEYAWNLLCKKEGINMVFQDREEAIKYFKNQFTYSMALVQDEDFKFEFVVRIYEKEKIDITYTKKAKQTKEVKPEITQVIITRSKINGWIVTLLIASVLASMAAILVTILY